MAQTGAKPKPTHIKLIQGNPGRRPLNVNEPTPDVREEAPVAPEMLSDAEAKVWDEAAQQLYAAGLLTKIDEAALTLYCVTFARWRWATDKLREPATWVYTMLPEAQGISRDAYISQGWTDEQLVAYGYMKEPEYIDPHVMKTKSGYLAHSPYLAIANKCFDQLRAMLAEFGMTPSSRSRVTVAPKDGDDSMDAFLGAKRP